jgi:hypothetical protein
MDVEQLVGREFARETEVLRENPPQRRHDLAYDGTRAAAVEKPTNRLSYGTDLFD